MSATTTTTNASSYSVSAPAAFTGSCACKRICYTSTSLPSRIVNCHCTECRKASGSPYQTWTNNRVSDITWTTSPPHYSQETSDYATRGFCRDCGSSLTMWYRSKPGLVGIAAGTIDDGSVKGEGMEFPKPGKHIFLREKARWFVLPDDGLERWEGFSDDMAKMYNVPSG